MTDPTVMLEDEDYYAEKRMSDFSLPPELAKAVNSVMAAVPKLPKDENNTFSRYKFAGIDAFLEATRPLCADVGLIILQDEESFEVIDGGKNDKGKDVRWLRMTYAFNLAHISGDTWGPLKRSIMVDAAMGAQGFGAAQSYALKQFMRALFQIATGENEDADTHPQSNLPIRSKDDPNWQGPMNKTQLKSALREAGDFVRGCETGDGLVAYLKGTKYHALSKQAAHDLPGWFEGDGKDVKGFKQLIIERADELEIAPIDVPPLDPMEKAE